MGAITINNFALLTVFLLVNTLFTYGQYDTLSNGAYRNIVDFNYNNPLYTCEFEFVNQKNRKIPELFSVSSPNKKIKAKSFRFEIKFIKTDSIIYLNTARLGMIEGYVKIHPIQTYCYFRGIPIFSINQNNSIKNSAAAFGFIGGASKSVKVKKEIENNIHYVFNLKSGMTNLLTKEYMLRLLESEPEYAYLLKMFENEANNDSNEICRKYLEFVNHVILK